MLNNIAFLKAQNASDATWNDQPVISKIAEPFKKLKEFNEHEIMAIAPTAGHALGGSRFNENFIQHDTGLFQINSGNLLPQRISQGLSYNVLFILEISVAT